MISISNDRIWVEINSLGAELENIFIDGKNILWKRSSEWNGQSPILFPICGSIKDDYYIYNEKKYELKRHGFARNKVFQLIEKKDNEAIFKLSHDSETFKKFPFMFDFYLKYLVIDNELIMELLINNLDDKDLYASCGTHPGFDIMKLKDFLGDNIFIIYDIINTNQLYFDDNGYVVDIKPKSLKSDALHTFINEIVCKKTICYEGIKNVQLIGSKGKITVDTDSKYMAFWCNKNQNFICIEGWDGIPDLLNTNYKLEEKVGINKIESKNTHKVRFSLKFEK